MFIRKRTSMVFVLVLTVLYLESKKLVSLCSNFVKLYHEKIYQSILCKNSYPCDFVAKCIKIFLESLKDKYSCNYSTSKELDDIWVNFCFKFALELIVSWKINSPTVIFELYFRPSASWLIFSHSKIEFLFSYFLTLFINLSVVAAMLPTMTKLTRF